MTASNSVPQCAPHADHCHLCGDDAIVGRVLDINARERTATVRFAEGTATVALDLVDAVVGDDLLVQLGFAIERVSAP